MTTVGGFGKVGRYRHFINSPALQGKLEGDSEEPRLWFINRSAKFLDLSIFLLRIPNLLKMDYCDKIFESDQIEEREDNYKMILDNSKFQV